jgi:single-strand DNA-binding protein
MADIESSESEASSNDSRERTSRWRGPVVNRVDLLGRLTADPTLQHTGTGIPVAHVRVATNDRSETEFHQGVAWRNLADIVMRVGHKGQLVHVVGRLHANVWTGNDGTRHEATEIIAESFQVLERKRTG